MVKVTPVRVIRDLLMNWPVPLAVRVSPLPQTGFQPVGKTKVAPFPAATVTLVNLVTAATLRVEVASERVSWMLPLSCPARSTSPPVEELTVVVEKVLVSVARSERLILLPAPLAWIELAAGE